MEKQENNSARESAYAPDLKPEPTAGWLLLETGPSESAKWTRSVYVKEIDNAGVIVRTTLVNDRVLTREIQIGDQVGTVLVEGCIPTGDIHDDSIFIPGASIVDGKIHYPKFEALPMQAFSMPPPRPTVNINLG